MAKVIVEIDLPDFTKREIEVESSEQWFQDDKIIFDIIGDLKHLAWEDSDDFLAFKFLGIRE